MVKFHLASVSTAESNCARSKARNDYIVVHSDWAERGQAARARTRSLSFVLLWESLSPYINRFLSADTIVPGYANPQNLNRYSYVVNNPLRFTDPTGHMADPGEGGGTINRTKYPCAGMLGLARDICSRGPKKPKTPKEIVKDLVTFFDPRDFLNDALSYPGPEGNLPTYFFRSLCHLAKCDPQRLKLGWNVGKRIVYPIVATAFAPKQTWLTPSATPSPFISPTAEFTPTLITGQNTLIPTATPTSSLTVTPSITPTQPTLTSTPIDTPVYWIP